MGYGEGHGRAIYITPYHIMGYRDIVIIPKQLKRTSLVNPMGSDTMVAFVFVLGLSH